jgi:hypothetical protein
MVASFSGHLSVVVGTDVTLSCKFYEWFASFGSTTSLEMTRQSVLLVTWKLPRKSWNLMFAIFLGLCAVFFEDAKALPQDSQPQNSQSVVDAARRSREQKKNVAKSSRVITNDDLDRKRAKRGPDNFDIGVSTALPGVPPITDTALIAVPANPSANLAYEESSSTRSESDEATAEDAEIAWLRDQIASKQNEWTWLQRAHLLHQNTVYSNPLYLTTRSGQAELDSEQFHMDEVQKEIDGLSESLAELEWRQSRRK